MDRSLFDAARRRPVLLLAVATALFFALMAVQAQADTHAPSTVTLCANPSGQLTIAPQSGCLVNATAFEVATGEGLDDAIANLAAADAALADRLDTLETIVEDLVTANTELTTRVTDLETANTDLADSLGAAEGRIDDLESLVSELEDLVDGLLGAVDLSADVEALQATFDGVTRDGDTLLFDGMNVQVVNGTGTTDGEPNGIGNLIIGYNTVLINGYNRSGSHYLVVGDEHDYTAFGGIVAGFSNIASGDWASVSGGPFNEASGDFASVSAGTFNTASGDYASVSGGSGNTASGDFAKVSAGFRNTASGERASVSGGQLNVASGFLSSILGGSGITVSDDNGTSPQ